MDRKNNVTETSYSYQPSFPFTCIITGAPASGKTFKIMDLIINRKKYFMHDLDVIYCYGVWQSKFDELKEKCPEIIFVNSIWEIDTNLKDGNKTMVIIDDKISEIEFDVQQNRYVRDLVTKRSRHEDLGVIITTQIAFPAKFRGLSLNAKYLIFFPNRRDKSYINLVNRQFCPEAKRWLYDALNASVRNNKYGSITLDMSPDCPEILSVRSDLFIDPHNELFQIYYVPCDPN